MNKASAQKLASRFRFPGLQVQIDESRARVAADGYARGYAVVLYARQYNRAIRLVQPSEANNALEICTALLGDEQMPEETPRPVRTMTQLSEQDRQVIRERYGPYLPRGVGRLHRAQEEGRVSIATLAAQYHVHRKTIIAILREQEGIHEEQHK